MDRVKFVEDSILKNLPKQTISLQRLSSTSFTWSILEYLDLFVETRNSSLTLQLSLEIALQRSRF